MHWTAVHWDEDMENQGSMKPRLASAQKAVAVRPPRPVTAPTPPLPRGPPYRPSASSSGSRSASSHHAASDATSHSPESHSDESDAGETDSEASSESLSDDGDDDDPPSSSSRMNGGGSTFLQDSDHVSWDQLPDRCLRDRCLRPLSKLQQQNFMTSGKEQNPQAEPGGLIWQNSGFLMPFTPDLVTLKRGQSRQISTAATGVSVLDSGRHEHHLLSQVVLVNSCIVASSLSQNLSCCKQFESKVLSSADAMLTASLELQANFPTRSEEAAQSPH